MHTYFKSTVQVKNTNCNLPRTHKNMAFALQIKLPIFLSSREKDRPLFCIIINKKSSQNTYRN